MVGAIADWFAVTALFRHPLGLPIPHTALVPRKKDEFGKSLEEFFAENFLHEEVIRERLAAADISRRVGSLARPTRPTPHGWWPRRPPCWRSGCASCATRTSRRSCEEVLIPRFMAEPISPVAGGLLQEIVADNAHHGLVDLALEEGHRWLVHNQETFSDVIGERAPWWAPDRLNDVVTARLHLEAIRWVADIRRDPQHHARLALDSLLRQLAHDLLNDPATQERAEKLKMRVLEQPQMVKHRHVPVERFPQGAARRARGRGRPVARAGQPGSWPPSGSASAVTTPCASKLDTWAADFVVWAVGRYGDELTAVITQTIERWDGKEAAREDRAARRPGPAVHPDQRHRRRRARRRGHPRGLAGAVTAHIEDVPIRDESIRLGQFLKLANLIDSRLGRQGADDPGRRHRQRRGRDPPWPPAGAGRRGRPGRCRVASCRALGRTSRERPGRRTDKAGGVLRRSLTFSGVASPENVRNPRLTGETCTA